ncbi:DUF4190 domain-containing protein [Demequina phytophila]|uniref:DUF4190 domain-containing protein n=1 Tax=Demequina phytophila TaxID=1638981 RepID=UPI0007834F45|nr:DUF4190 domain-containing protein [Demequina phytophila]
MSTTNDPFSQQPPEGTMRPAESSVQPHQGWEPQATAETPAPAAADLPPAPAAPAPAPTAPGYAAPPAPSAGYGGYAPRPAKTWMNITSLVTSLVGLGLLGVIFGHLGVAAAKRGEADYKGMGIAGLIIGYIGIVATIIYVIAIIAFVSAGTVTVQ